MVLQERWMNLRADTCVTGAGVEIAPYYILENKEWACVLAVDQQDRVVMVEQYRHGLGVMSLELPGGVVDDEDGDIATAARRELAEETGYSCGPLTFVAAIGANPATHDNRLHIYCARDAQATGTTNFDAAEEINVHLVPIPEARRLALSGAMPHGLQTAAVLLAIEKVMSSK